MEGRMEGIHRKDMKGREMTRGQGATKVLELSLEPRLAGLAAHSAGGCAACYAAMGFDT